jgi:excisionase family DNA binding protein
MAIAFEQRPTTDIKGAAQYLSMSRSWVIAAIAKKKLPSIRLGRSVRLLYSDLDRFLEARRTGGDQ